MHDWDLLGSTTFAFDALVIIEDDAATLLAVLELEFSIFLVLGETSINNYFLDFFHLLESLLLGALPER